MNEDRISKRGCLQGKIETVYCVFLCVLACIISYFTCFVNFKQNGSKNIVFVRGHYDAKGGQKIRPSLLKFNTAAVITKYLFLRGIAYFFPNLRLSYI